MLKGLFGKKDKDDDGIVVVRKTKPCTCGGTDATQDTRAPKKIESDEMILFNATTALGGGVMIRPDGTMVHPNLQYISAFAAPGDEGTFLFLETAKGEYRAEHVNSWAYVKEDIFPTLVQLVNECDLARGNGYHSQTHGLPENFGGSVDIRYKSGERISFSNNQCPIIAPDAAEKIADVFEKAMQSERVTLPDVSDLCEIRFIEKREDGGFTEATLTIAPDGTAENYKKSRYDNPTVYESTKPVDKDTVDLIRRNIERTGILAWASLPDSGFALCGDKQLTFVFSDGREIAVKDGKAVSSRIQGGFFNIELEMTTKH